MKIAMWAAILATLLMGLANLGLLTQDNLALKILGPVLFVAAVVAVVGMATSRAWGVPAVISVGAVNLVGAIIGAVVGVDGWPLGLVLSGLAVVLALVARPGSRRLATS